MFVLKRTSAKDSHFIELVKQLDTYLKIIDGEDHDFYKTFNTIESLHHVVVGYSNEHAVGCGAFKIIDDCAVEIKRMYVRDDERGKKVASQILQELELWARELGFRIARLETGSRMPDAIAFYQNKGYVRTPNYGQYVGMANSNCFKKNLVIKDEL